MVSKSQNIKFISDLYQRLNLLVVESRNQFGC